jgi:c(7)-type cytochrome triheme protein
MKRTSRTVLFLLAASASLSCYSVAAVFFDLPSRSVQTNVQQAALAGSPMGALDGVAPQDTVRPPIESTLSPDSVLSMLPKDATGNIAWVVAHRTGVINPRSAPPGVSQPPAMTGFGFDFVLESVAEMFNAVFPHSAHVELMTCGTCHPAIYPFRTQETTMEEINGGESCGRCHGSVAFPVSACFRCHTTMPVSGTVEPTLYDDITFTRPDSIEGFAGAAGDVNPAARFPHWIHRIRYKCMACHTSLFNTRVGADTLRKADMRNGKSCGACHDGSAAFPLLECNRCHSEATAGDGDSRE